MSDFFIALMAASFSTLGSLLLQMFVARTNRDLMYNDKRLASLLDVRQVVEEACGRWHGWASAVLDDERVDDPLKLRQEAGDAMHRAWFATRVFEMYFPKMTHEANSMRKMLMAYRDEAHAQVEAGGAFDPSKFDVMFTVDFDAITNSARRRLGFPDS